MTGKTSRNTPSAPMSAPPRSSRGADGTADSSTHAQAAARAARPIGMLIRKIGRQPSDATSALISPPPISGATTAPIPVTAPNSPNAASRWPAGNHTVMLARTCGSITAALTPCSTRLVIRKAGSGAAPDSSEVTMKAARPAMKTRLRPQMSPSLPPVISAPAKASESPAATHWTWPYDAPRSLRIDGTATLAIVTSISSMNTAISITAVPSHVRRLTCTAGPAASRSVPFAPFVDTVRLLQVGRVVLLIVNIDIINMSSIKLPCTLRDVTSTETEARGNVGFLIWRLSMRWRAAMDRALAPLGLTQAQYAVLAPLYGMSRGGTRPSQRELADLTGLDPVYVSKLVRALERDGFVTRSVKAADPRAVELALTAHGAAAVQEGVKAVHDLRERLTRPPGGNGGTRTADPAEMLQDPLAAPEAGS